MHKIKFVFLGSILLILLGCANDSIPKPPKEYGVTTAQLPTVCITVNQNVTKSSTIYYVKAAKESKVVKECGFKGASVYFSNITWKSLNKVLSNYDSNAIIIPGFKKHREGEAPSYSIHVLMLHGRLIGDDSKEEHYLALWAQPNGTWAIQLIDDKIGQVE